MTLDIARATAETFDTLVGTTFVIQFSDAQVDLLLDNVKRHSAASMRDSTVVIDGAEVPPRPSFALTFEAPRDALLRQGVYTLEHAQIGRLDLFLSPFRQDATCVLYEAVFN